MLRRAGQWRARFLSLPLAAYSETLRLRSRMAAKPASTVAIKASVHSLSVGTGVAPTTGGGVVVAAIASVTLKLVLPDAGVTVDGNHS